MQSTDVNVREEWYNRGERQKGEKESRERKEK